MILQWYYSIRTEIHNNNITVIKYCNLQSFCQHLSVYDASLYSLSFNSSFSFSLFDSFLWQNIYVDGISRLMPLLLHFPVSWMETCPPCFKNKFVTVSEARGWRWFVCAFFCPPLVLWQQHEYREDYEATDVGSWSCVGSHVPARNESMLKLYMKQTIYSSVGLKHRIGIPRSQVQTPLKSRLYQAFLRNCKKFPPQLRGS